MNWQEYRTNAKQVVDFIADYMENIRSYRVFPAVQPGYMRQLLPDIAPNKGENWNLIMDDIKELILPGITHWQSPHMHAYFPALNSPASLLGDMLADAFNCLGFTWASSPACTELEVIVMDWLGKAIKLPPCFLNQHSNGKGGGVIQTTSSEATFVALLCARTEAIRQVKHQQQQQFKQWERQQQQLKLLMQKQQTNVKHLTIEQDEQDDLEKNLLEETTFDASGEFSSKYLLQQQITPPTLEEDSEINSRLVAYCSDQAHSSVEKASLIGLVKLRYIESDDQYSLKCDQLEKTIINDIEELNLTPFFICATLGTTGCCSFDDLKKICTIARKFNCYVHVDAAYTGSAFICDEFTYLMNGIEQVNSFAFNPSKWLNVNFDCTALWFQNVSGLHRTFNVNPIYLKHENTGFAIDYMHWQIPLSRRFRALKLWCVLRNFGLDGLRKHIRKSVALAALFERLLRKDNRFILAAERILGLVVFRLLQGNELTELLLKRLNSEGKIHCVPASLKSTYVIRFTVTSAQTTEDDIKRDWHVIQEMATKILKEQQLVTENELSYTDSMALAQPMSKNHVKTPKLQQLAASFGTSLLLCNSPMTPKLVNGSFAAIMDNQDVVAEFVRKFGAKWDWQKNVHCNNNAELRRRIKGLMLSDKQYSLDSRMDLVDSIMSTINMDDEKNKKELSRSNGSIKERKARRQAKIFQQINAEDDKSSENSIQEEDEHIVNEPSKKVQ